MKILVIENVNYEDYPTGGIMNFYRNMLDSFGKDLLMAGITTDNKTPVGKWTKREIKGVEYDYFSMARVKPSPKKPIIPERIKNCFHVKKYINRILDRDDYDVIFTRTPEVLYYIPDQYLSKTCNYLPGVGNPLAISRYPWARRFAKSYDRFFLMPKAAKTRWLLAAADYNARKGFAERSRGLIKAEHIIQFPTRFDDKYYYIDDNATREEKIIFVTVGRLGWFKGWKLMIDALKLTREKVNNARLYFIGDGGDHDKIKGYIHEQGLDDSVILLGKMAPKEIAVWLNKADVFVMGSMAEGWSTTLVEACACGVPCVVTDFSSAREMVADGENGFVVSGRDERDFSHKMVEALGLDREKVIEYDKRFEGLAVSHLREDMERILN